MASSGSAPSDVKKDSNPKMNKEEVINKKKDVSASLENEKLKKQEVNKDNDASAGLEIDQEEVSSVKKKRKRDEDASGSEEASRIQAQEERKKRRLERRRRNTDKYQAEAREWNWKGAYEQALRSVAKDNAWLDNEKARINRLKELKKFLGPNSNLDKQEIHDIKRWDTLNEQRKFRETNPEQNELAIRELACSALKTWQGIDNVFNLVDKELEPESESEKDNR
ncbi:stress response protein nst1 isoform X1 [Rosa chinensis]|uniref:stress response protein nst1 isoform X1 n=1 Tax=Rosa chinensis TaxID=74649 RepID=UPI000D08A1ED|nr:stress response protein nst1 isoform X1 [Rosa chinensis]